MPPTTLIKCSLACEATKVNVCSHEQQAHLLMHVFYSSNKCALQLQFQTSLNDRITHTERQSIQLLAVGYSRLTGFISLVMFTSTADKLASAMQRHRFDDLMNNFSD